MADDIYDINGRPIREGDLLRLFHFVGSRGRKHYLYHVVCWNEKESHLECVPVQYLNPRHAARDTGGRFWLKQELIDDSKAEIIAGNGSAAMLKAGRLDCWEDRKKRPLPLPPEPKE